MSRGLGTLQREILATLDEAKAAPTPYPGGSLSGPGWVRVNGRSVALHAGVYDLRASRRFLATRRGVVHHTPPYRPWVESTFEASFSRAVRTLIARGALVWCDEDGQTPLWRTTGGIPTGEWDRTWDGLLRPRLSRARSAERRFVRRPGAHDDDAEARAADDLGRLRRDAPDLATLVERETLSLREALAIAGRRRLTAGAP